MTQKKWLYTLTLRTINMRKVRNLSLECNRCGEELKIGERAYSRNSHNSSKSKSKIYHEPCAIEVNIL